MSFNTEKSHIEEGDKVILYLTFNQIYAVSAVGKIQSKKGVEVDNVFQTKFGALRGGDLIGKEYGSKIQLSSGWGYVLKPTPELWTSTLPHRTQIIYTPDISMITWQLEIKPGSVVLECGTGSGSLSHALIRTVKPHGHLYTFDFHDLRVEIAREEFKTHGLEEFVTVNQRDVCSEGFPPELDSKADAIFLDLPHPWLAVTESVRSFKKSGGRICTFSPCIEQVQKTVACLNELQFQEIQTIDLVSTEYSVTNQTIPTLNLDFLKTPKSEEVEVVKEEKSENVYKFSACEPVSTQASHTGYLTFATYPPECAR